MHLIRKVCANGCRWAHVACWLAAIGHHHDITTSCLNLCVHSQEAGSDDVVVGGGDGGDSGNVGGSAQGRPLTPHPDPPSPAGGGDPRPRARTRPRPRQRGGGGGRCSPPGPEPSPPLTTGPDTNSSQQGQAQGQQVLLAQGGPVVQCPGLPLPQTHLWLQLV